MEQLPPHVLTRITEYALNEGGSQGIINLLLVNSAFYLSIIPILYRSTRIIHNFESFLNHSEQPYPSNIDTIDTAELIRAGHTKLAALRYVRTLFIDVSALYDAADDDDLQMTEEQKSQVERDQTHALIRQMDMAEKHLTRMPTGIFRSLKIIRTGDAALVMGTPRKKGAQRKSAVGPQYVSRLTQELLQRSTPEIWCETPRSTIYLSLTRPTEATFANFGTGTVIVNHIQPCDEIRLIRNATNYIYVHSWACTVHVHNECDKLTDSQILRWLSTRIELSFPKASRYTSEPVDKGRIIIGGLYESIVKSIKSMQVASGAEEEQERIEWYRSMETMLTRDFEGVVEIDFRRANDMPPCPGCGALCG